MQRVEVIFQVTVQVDVEAADKQSAIEAVWDEWHSDQERQKLYLDLPGIVRSNAKLELWTVDGVDEDPDAETD